jgi:hypothetical protein
MGLSIGLSSAGNPAYRSLQVFIQPVFLVFLSWVPKLREYHDRHARLKRKTLKPGSLG